LLITSPKPLIQNKKEKRKESKKSLDWRWREAERDVGSGEKKEIR